MEDALRHLVKVAMGMQEGTDFFLVEMNDRGTDEPPGILFAINPSVFADEQLSPIAQQLRNLCKTAVSI